LLKADRKNLYDLKPGIIHPDLRNRDNILDNIILRFLNRIERSYGSFYRSFTVPRHIDQEKIKAEHDNGVLRITMP